MVSIQSVLRLVSSWEIPERDSRKACGREKSNLKGGRGEKSEEEKSGE